MKIYNTFTKSKEDFIPREEGKVSIYVCGPTVYNYIHIGNARTFLNFDMIRRYLAYRGYEVTFVQNITDVDDKIINRAKEEKISPEEVAEKYRVAFEEDMEKLGILPPDVSPRATEHIEEMIEVIEGLVSKGHAYISNGDVYFDVSTFPSYGKLSGRELSEQMPSECTTGIEKKRDPYDFALWKAAKPGEPCWESPWGPGRPGWHIECSTMSVKYLGNGFDIHGGGQDLIFPHHENEIAQAEGYSGERFVRYWVHSGMLTIGDEKMSKSIGNIRLLRDVLKEHDPQTIRMLALLVHYRSPLSFSGETLAEAKASCERIKNCVFNLRDLLRRFEGEKIHLERTEREVRLLDFLEESEKKFTEAMDDDFNSAAALGTLFGLVREVNSYADEVSIYRSPASRLVLSEVLVRILRMTEAIGLSFEEEEAEEKSAGKGPSVEELIELLLYARQFARERGEYEIADMIREKLGSLGVRVEDVRGGYRWRLLK